jgi:hypothetical protein
MTSVRSKAKQDNKKHYFTGLPCKNGHIDKRHTNDGVCMACSREKSAKWVQLNREKFLEGIASNEKRKLKAKLFTKQWKLTNPEKRNALEANRRAAKLQRTPS